MKRHNLIQLYSLLMIGITFFSGIERAIAVDITETRIDAADRFEINLGNPEISPEEIRFSLTLSGNGDETEADCVETYLDGVREGNADAPLCAVVRQEFSFFNGVIPADAEIIKITLAFDDFSSLKFYPSGDRANQPEPFWTKGGYKLKINFYNPDNMDFDENGNEITDTDILRGYATADRLGIYLAGFAYGIHQIAFGINYRIDYLSPFLSAPPIKSADDDYFHGLGGTAVVDRIPGGSGGPTIADLVESGETDIIENLPDNPVLDALVVYTYNDSRFRNGYSYSGMETNLLRIDLALSAPNVIITYRTKEGGIGNWIGSIWNDCTVQYNLLSD